MKIHMLLAFAGLAIGSEHPHRCHFRPNVFWSQRILLPLMVLATALANAWPVHASLADAGHRGFPGRSGAAAGWAARPGLGTFDWLAGLGLNAALGPKVTSAAQRGVAAAYGRLPLSFEANAGQSDPRVRFLARGQGYALFLTSNAEAVLVSSQGQFQAVCVELAGANTTPEVQGIEEQPAKSYYFIGNDPARWRAQVANYGRVRYGEVYPGIDLIYYGNQRQLEYDWVVAPGADPGRIQLCFPDVKQLRLDPESGDLEVLAAEGEVRLHGPVAYQLAEGERVAVEARYALGAADRVGFALGRYDTTKPLVIDPVLTYSTYLGGSDDDLGEAIAVDGVGNAYVTGATNSPDFPLAHPLPAPNNALRGKADTFVSKLRFDPCTGTLSLAYSAYLGGTDTNGDFGYGIAVDMAGNAYVTGYTTSPDFPLAHPLPAPNNALQGIIDAFVSKLHFDERTGTLSLAYSTYLGGSDFEIAYGIAVDLAGNAYVTGDTTSPDFPLAHPLPAPNNALRGSDDAFVSKLSFDARTGTLSLAYSTYLGGSGHDLGNGIAVDRDGNAYVAGYTQSPDFPLAHPLPAPNNTLRGSGDAFVSKLDFDERTGTLSLAYSTYLGGTGDDSGWAIAVDQVGDACVTGNTTSPDFSLVHPLVMPHNAYRGETDAFVSKLSFDARTATLSLAYSTYLGGSGLDLGQGIAVDRDGNAYVTGNTTSPDFPLVHPLAAPHNALQGRQAAFVSKLSFDARSGALRLAYSSYLGGSNFDQGNGIAVDRDGNAYVTGATQSTDFPLAHPLPAPNNAYQGFDDVFVTKIAGERPGEEEK